MEIEVHRFYFPNGTNGDLFIDGKPFCHTIELPWKNNQSKISCIPEGRYKCIKHKSAHLGDVLWLQNVPNRDMIYIHKANDAKKELLGCVAPVTTLTGQGTGSSSGAVFNPLLKQAYSEIDKGNEVWITFKKI